MSTYLVRIFFFYLNKPGTSTFLSVSTNFPSTCIKSTNGSETAPPSTPECKSARWLQMDTVACTTPLNPYVIQGTSSPNQYELLFYLILIPLIKQQ